MKRIAKKSPHIITPEENERLRQLRETIDLEERAEIIDLGRSHFKQRSEAELLEPEKQRVDPT